jgi:cysteine protease ATG4
LSALLAQQAVEPAATNFSSGGGQRGGKGPNALLMAAKHGKGHLDKAMRYLLDSDAVPDKCTDSIWLLGIHHPGYEPPPPAPPSPGAEKKRQSSASPPVSFRSSTASTTFPESPLSQSTSSLAASSGKSVNANSNKLDPSANWRPAFDHDFTSRVWLTYRSQFSIPISDMRLGDLSTTDNW